MNIDAKLALEIAAVVLTLTGLFAGLFQYRKAQKWKVLEFVANEMKEFENEPEVQNAMYMLDWDEKEILLYPDEEGDEKWELVDSEMVYKSLEPNGRRFDEAEVAIRDSFDLFFSYLEGFEHYILTGLVKYENLYPYITYWLDKISAGDKDLTKRIRQFLKTYEYTGVINLIKRNNEYKKMVKSN